jgi:hypothetical protein
MIARAKPKRPDMRRAGGPASTMRWVLVIVGSCSIPRKWAVLPARFLGVSRVPPALIAPQECASQRDRCYLRAVRRASFCASHRNGGADGVVPNTAL